MLHRLAAELLSFPTVGRLSERLTAVVLARRGSIPVRFYVYT